ncbi:MAG TPA: hypothetical protein DCQ64_27590, partial [Candidatus Rokubacteria bacterium]|nr:hypothetical protein [Candidatus Rokubacteria bacterium]
MGPSGYFLRDPATRKPLVWDLDRERTVPFDDRLCVRPAMEGEYLAAGVEVGADEAVTSVSQR